MESTEQRRNSPVGGIEIDPGAKQRRGPIKEAAIDLGAGGFLFLAALFAGAGVPSNGWLEADKALVSPAILTLIGIGFVGGVFFGGFCWSLTHKWVRVAIQPITPPPAPTPAPTPTPVDLADPRYSKPGTKIEPITPPPVNHPLWGKMRGTASPDAASAVSGRRSFASETETFRY